MKRLSVLFLVSIFCASLSCGNVLNDIRDNLAAGHRWTWTHPSDLTDNISPDSQGIFSPKVALDNNGNAIIVWYQSDGSYYQIFKSEYRNGLWTHPSDLMYNISPNNQHSFAPAVAMDDNGNAIIVWYQFDDTSNYQIFKSEYRSGLWTHPSGLTDNISPDGQYAEDSAVAMDDNGNAIIIWRQYDGPVGNYQIFKSEFRGGLWAHPLNLTDNISPDGQDVLEPSMAMDNKGNAIIVWVQSDSSNYQIFKSEYRDGFWTHPSDLTDNISPDGQSARVPRVAMDNNGNAIIVWFQYDGPVGNYQIFKSEYRSGLWTHPSGLIDNISPDGQDAREPEVAMDDNDNAIIVWSQSDGLNDQVFKSEYRSGSWMHPSDLTDNISPDDQGVYKPRVAMDDNGNAIIVWYQSDGLNNQIFKSEYRSGSWMHPSSLTDNISPDGQNAGDSEIAMDNNGNAIIVWRQSDGSVFQVFKSEYR